MDLALVRLTTESSQFMKLSRTTRNNRYVEKKIYDIVNWSEAVFNNNFARNITLEDGTKLYDKLHWDINQIKDLRSQLEKNKNNMKILIGVSTTYVVANIGLKIYKSIKKLN